LAVKDQGKKKSPYLGGVSIASIKGACIGAGRRTCLTAANAFLLPGLSMLGGYPFSSRFIMALAVISVSAFSIKSFRSNAS
jgi:hypothetical protein